MKHDPQPDARPPAERVAKNTVLRVVAEIAGKLASLLLFAFIARSLGADTLGDYIFALSIGELIWAVAGFGLDKMALREIARDRVAGVQRLFYDVISFKLVAGVVGVALATGAVTLLGYPSQVTWLVALLGLATLLTLLAWTALAVFQAFERFEYYLIAYVPTRILTAVFGIVALLAGAGIVAVALGAVAGALLGLATALFLLYRFFARPTPSLGLRGLPQLTRDASAFGFNDIAAVSLSRADVILLSLMTSSAVVGFYGSAYRLLDATYFISRSIAVSVVPMFSYLDRDSTPSVDRVLEGALKFTTVAVTPVAITLLVCAEPIIDLIFGLPEYAESVTVLRILAAVALIYGLGNLASVFILTRLRGQVIVKVIASAAGVNIALNLVLIPQFGAVGAAVATLVAESFRLVVVLVIVARTVDAPSISTVTASAAIAAAAMALVMIPLSPQLLLALPIGAAVYLAVLAACEARSPRGDLQTVRRMFLNRAASSGRAPA